MIRTYRPHWAGTPHDGYTQYAFDLLDRVTTETDHGSTGGVYRTRSTALCRFRKFVVSPT